MVGGIARSLSWLVVLLAVLIIPVWAQAQSPTAPEQPSRMRDARDHFSRGMEAYGARDYRRAAQEFLVAAELVPAADLWFNAARCYEEMGDDELAIEYFRRYLRDRVDAPDAAAVEGKIATMEERVATARRRARRSTTTGSLRIDTTAPATAVRLDGAPVEGTGPPLDVEAGRHVLEVDHEDHIPQRAELSVSPGVLTVADLRAAPRTRFRSVRGDHLFTYIAAGLAGAAVVVAAGFGVAASGAEGDRARQLATRADYALGGALGLGLLAGVLYFVEGRAVGTEQISAAPAAGGQVEGVRGAWEQ